MPTTAHLLLRETSTACLTALVDKSLHVPPPHAEYTLRLTRDALVLLTSETPTSSAVTDEGFESDIESVVSSIGGDCKTPNNDNDSANGSTTSSDCESEPPIVATNLLGERYDLVDCSCYDLEEHARMLVFVINNKSVSVLVFRFERGEHLRAFYANFSALKALANQRAAGGAPNVNRYSLLQRTDRNGVTHIEITNNREAATTQPIILVRDERAALRKVWRSNSAENLLEQKRDFCTQPRLEPKKPERRKKPPAPQPPPSVVPTVREKKTPLLSLAAWTTLLKQKNKEPTARNYAPMMAYRYIDATVHRCHGNNGAAMTDRLFGLSPRLRDFGFHGDAPTHQKWKSATDLTLSRGDDATCLKSVIKNKEENKKKNKKNKEKKVTFSAYTTVQVV